MLSKSIENIQLAQWYQYTQVYLEQVKIFPKQIIYEIQKKNKDLQKF